MPLDLADYENKAKEAIKAFWGNRAAAVAKQRELGRADQGERAGVTAGKNMDGFMALIKDVVRANGLRDAHMMIERRVLCLPGFFRPTKLWDLLVINEGRLIAALKLPFSLITLCDCFSEAASFPLDKHNGSGIYVL